jgi:hypothetical protein
MRVETLLNHVQKFKSFVYLKARLVNGEDHVDAVLRVQVQPRKNTLTPRLFAATCGILQWSHMGVLLAFIFHARTQSRQDRQ